MLDSLRRLALGRTVILASHSAAAHAFGGRRLDIAHGRRFAGAGRCVSAIAEILRLWRGRAGWLALGMLISLGALTAAIALMVRSRATMVTAALLAGALLAPFLLRGAGVARVVLRYLERVHHARGDVPCTHRRAGVVLPPDLRRSSAGGLGYRRAGDILARAGGDIDALDGLYLRVLLRSRWRGPAVCR